MKVVLLHPPMYPVNHEFYNMLALKVELVVYQICEYPVHHIDWTDRRIRKDKPNYELKILSKGSLTSLKTLNPIFLLKIIKDKPDIVVSIAFWLPSLYISILRSVSSFKFIVLTNAIPQTERKISGIKKIIRWLIGKNVDVFISASHLTTEYLSSLYPSEKIMLSMQTMNVLKWQNNLELLESKKNLLEKLNLPKDKKIMLGIGNYTDKKNWKTVIKIMRDMENLYFILVGYGIQKEEYCKLIHDFNIENKVLIAGKKDSNEILKYYRVSDFLIFPSKYDQFGFVVPEALSSGLPVICTKNAGSASLIQEEVNGYFIDPANYDKNVIEKMLINLDKLKINAKTSISEYTLENRVDEFIHIFNMKSINDVS